MTDKIKLFIGGEWIEGGGRDTIAVINPANEKPVSELCMATVEDLERALEAADRGFRVWRNHASRRTSATNAKRRSTVT